MKQTLSILCFFLLCNLAFAQSQQSPITGTKSQLDTKLSSVGDGTYAYATDEHVGYQKCNGVWTFVPNKRQECYSGTTNSSGVYTISFTTAYAVAPNIQASITNQGGSNQYLRVTAVSTTGFTINAYSFSTNTILGIINLTSTTANTNGATVDVIVTEK